MLISDMLRNVDWDACQAFETAGGVRCFGITCKDKDDLLAILSSAIDFYYSQEGCSDTRVIRLLLSGEEMHAANYSTMVWPTVPWDDPWCGEGESERCDDMAVAQHAEDMNLMEQWREEEAK